jgi:hypothetical protein
MRKCPFCGRENGDQDAVCGRCRAGLPEAGNPKEEPVKVRKKSNERMKEHGT